MVANLSMLRPLSCLQEDCLAKMIYSGRKLVVGLAFSATSKYIELVTSAGAEVGKRLGMVLTPGYPGLESSGQVREEGGLLVTIQ